MPVGPWVTDASEDLAASFHVGQDSADLSATFHVGQDADDLKAIFMQKAQADMAVVQGVSVDVYVAKTIVI